MSLEQENNLCAGQLVITEKDVFGLEETWFTDHDKRTKTIHFSDNHLIPKHTVGMVVGFVTNLSTPVVTICWGGDLKGKLLVITLNKAILLERFIEKLDNEEITK